MTTEITWYTFPGRPDYEISDEGDLRTVNGDLIPLQYTSNGFPYYALPDTDIPGHYIHISPDGIIDYYLPYGVKV